MSDLSVTSPTSNTLASKTLENVGRNIFQFESARVLISLREEEHFECHDERRSWKGSSGTVCVDGVWQGEQVRAAIS